MYNLACLRTSINQFIDNETSCVLCCVSVCLYEYFKTPIHVCKHTPSTSGSILWLHKSRIVWKICSTSLKRSKIDFQKYAQQQRPNPPTLSTAFIVKERIITNSWLQRPKVVEFENGKFIGSGILRWKISRHHLRRSPPSSSLAKPGGSFQLL